MEITVQKINVGKTQKGSPKTGLFDGKEWFNIMGAHPEYDGKTLKLKKESFGQNWYAVEFVVDEKPGPASSGNGNGKVEWNDYVRLAEEAHKVALKLEPDEYELIRGGDEQTEPRVRIDRSRARVTFVNTALMALKDGKLWLDEDEDIPF